MINYNFDVDKETLRLHVFPETEFDHFANFCAMVVGDAKTQKDFFIERSELNYQLFLFSKQGEGIIELNGEVFQLPENHAVACDCLGHVKYYPKTDWQIEWIYFKTPNCNFLNEFKKLSSPVVKIANPSKLIAIFDSLFKTAKISDLSRSIEQSILFLEIIKMLLPVQKNSSKLDITLSFIDENIDKKITLDMLSKISNYSPSHLNRMFVENFSLSVYEYIIHRRIELAKTYIKMNLDTMENISYKCGFSNPSQFAKLFKKYVGTSPKNFCD